MNVAIIRNTASGRESETAGQTYQFLQQRRSGVLATVDAGSGRPHATVVYYSVQPDCSICFLTKKDTRKARDIAADPSVEFVVYDEYEQAVVQIRGTATQVQDPSEVHEQFMRTLRSSLNTADSAVPPVSKLTAGEYIEFVIVPDEIRYSEYKQRRSDGLEIS